MEVAPLVRDFLGLQGSRSPDEAVLVSKLQHLHERYVAIIDDFSVQVNAKALRMTSIERVMAHQLRLRIIQDWRRQLMDCIVQGIHQGGVDDDALEHKSDCACNDCKLTQRLDKYRSAIQDFIQVSGRINKGDDAGTEVTFNLPAFLDSLAIDQKEQSMQIQSIEAEAPLRVKHSQTGQKVGEEVVPDPESKSGHFSSRTVWFPANIDYEEEKEAADTATRNESILTSQTAPAAVLEGIDKNDDQKSETEMEQEVHQHAMEEQDTVPSVERISSLSISDKVRQLKWAACDRPHLCIYRSLVKRLNLMYGSAEDVKPAPKPILSLVERLDDSMSAIAFEFNGASMLLRGAVILCEANEYHNDLSLHRAENDVPREEWEGEWHQDCVDYVQVLKDHVSTSSTDSPPPSQTDVTRIVSKYVDVLPENVRSKFAEFFTEIFPARYAADSSSEWFISIFECQRQSTGRELAWWGDYKVQLRQSSYSDLEKLAKLRRLADLWSSLHHQHILRLFGASDSESLLFVCEHIQQKTLAEFSCDNSSTSEELFTFLFQVSLALLSLQEQDVWCQTLTCADVVIDLNISLVKLDLLHVDLSEDPSDGKSVELLRNIGDEAFALWFSGSRNPAQLGTVVKSWRSLFFGGDQSAPSSNVQPTLSEVTCAIYMEMIQLGRQPLNSLKSLLIEPDAWGLIEPLKTAGAPRSPCLRFFRPVLVHLSNALTSSLHPRPNISLVKRIGDFFSLYANSKTTVQLALARFSIQVAVSSLEQLDDLLQSTQLTNQRKLWEKPIQIWRDSFLQEWIELINDGVIAREIVSCTDNDHLEALTLIQYELVTHRAVMSASECKLYYTAFGLISGVSGMYLMNNPSWFTPSYRIRREKSRDEGITIKCSSFSSPGENSGWTFEEEIICNADRWSTLHHRNVLRLLCANHVGCDPLMAFEGSDSLPSLQKYLSSRKRKYSEIWQLLQEAAIGLAYLHKHQVVHRALTCDAILVCSEFVSRGANGSFQSDGCTNGQQLIKKSIVKLMSGSTNRVLVCAPAPDTVCIEEDQEVKPLKDMMIDDIAALGKCVSECLQYHDHAFADRKPNNEIDSELSDRARDLYTGMTERKDVTLTHMIAVSEELFEAWRSVEVLDQLEQRVQHDPTVEMSIKDAEQTSIGDVNHMCQQLMEIRKLGKESDRTNSLLDRLKHLYSQVISSQNANTQLKKRIVELISSVHQVLVPAENALISRTSTPSTQKKAMNISRIYRQLDEAKKTFEEMEHTVEQQKVSNQQPKYDYQGSEQTMFPMTLSTPLDHKRKTNLSGVDNLADRKGGPIALIRAAAYAHLAVTNNLVDCGADVNSTDKNGWTALMKAAHGGRLDLVRYLTKHGANVNATEDGGWTALMMAGRGGHWDVVRLLANEGAKVNATDKSGQTALMMAGRGGHVETVQHLIEYGADTNATDKSGQTALMMAGRGGHVETVRYLIEHGADTNATDKGGRTTLMWGAAGRHVAVVKLLLDNDVEANAMDNIGRTAMIIASKNGYLDVICCLVEGSSADGNLTSENRDIALMKAAFYGHLEVVRYLVEECGANVNATDKGRKTVLMRAVYKGRLGVVQYLVEESGVDVNAADEHGETALMKAAYNGRLKVVRYLADECGANVNAKDEGEKTPLMRAVYKGHLEVVRYLVDERGANVNATDKTGKSAIRIAVDRGHQQIVRILKPPLVDSQADILSFDSLSSCAIPPSEIALTRLVETNNVGGEYLAKWLDAVVTLKLFIPDTAHSSFVKEVRLWKRLRHPNVIKLYGACEAGPGLQFFVGEYADGGSLIEYIKSTPNKTRTVWKYLYEAALGLEYLHERGIAHGDLRCSNILIGSDNLARLSNFGPSGAKNWASSTVGSMRWQAPEILLGKELSPFASDVYSLGMCILEAITGKMPWGGVYEPRGRKTVWNPETEYYYSWSAPECPLGDARDLVWRMCCNDPTKRIKLQSIVYEFESLALKESLEHSEPQHERMITYDNYILGEIKDLWEQIETNMKCSNNPQHHQAFDELKLLYSHLNESTHHFTLLKRFHTLLTEFHALITMTDEQTLVMQLSSTRATTSIYACHRRIQSLWVALGQPVDTNITQTDAQRREMFVSGVSDLYLLLRELESDDEKAAFLEILKREMTDQQYTPTQLETMKKAVESIESKIGKESLVPEWFIPWYELVKSEDECLGVGGFGNVIRAKWLDSEVVVKQVDLFDFENKSLLFSDSFSVSQEYDSGDFVKRRADAMDMFRREVEIWFGFSHPHIIQLFGACHVGRPFFVCEYATNGTLVQYLRKHPDDLWQKLYEAALGVQYLHARGVVHGDLKGNNILVGSDMKAKVTDFGLSTIASDSGEVEISSASHWVAPECFVVDPELTFASDVYSLGMCIVESMRVVGGEDWSLPWRNTLNDVVKVMTKRGELPPRPSHCTDAQWELVKRMCSFQPEKRMKISTVVDELSRLANERDEATSESPSLELVPDVVSAMKSVLGEVQGSGREASKYLDLWNELEKVSKNVDGVQSSEVFCCLVKDAETATLKLLDKKTDLVPSLERTMAVHALQRRLVKFVEAYPYLGY